MIVFFFANHVVITELLEMLVICFRRDFVEDVPEENSIEKKSYFTWLTLHNNILSLLGIFPIFIRDYVEETSDEDYFLIAKKHNIVKKKYRSRRIISFDYGIVTGVTQYRYSFLFLPSYDYNILLRDVFVLFFSTEFCLRSTNYKIIS